MFELLAPFLGTAIDKLSGSDKASPPPSYGGAEGGSQYRDFLNSAFPGTTPWEQLGANTPVGAVQSANQSNKTADVMQKRDLRTRQYTSELSARAQVIAALGNTGPMAIKSGLDALHGKASPYDTVTQQGREALPSHVAKQSAEAALTGAKVGGEAERSRQMPSVIRSEKFGNYSRGISGLLGSAAGLVGAAKLGGPIGALADLPRSIRSAGKYVSDGYDIYFGNAPKRKPYGNY